MNIDFVPFIRGVGVLCKPRLIFSRVYGSNVTFIEISCLQLTEKVATFQFTKAFKILSLLLLPGRQLPVPLDKGNEGSEEEITNTVGGQTHFAPTQSKLCSARVRLACGHT